jgi:uncharacterized protein (TIGR02444 family)
VASDNPFWEFSLAVYRRPGVADACLRLQDEAGADVNLLLFFCWLALSRDEALGEVEIRDIVARTAGWRDHVVRPLRDVRRWMKGGAEGMPAGPVEALRSQVKRIELDSERLQQDMLFALADTAAVQAVAAQADRDSARRRANANTALYLSVIGAPRTVEVTEACHTVVAAGISG